MKASILIPILFAGSGAIWISFGANPKLEFSKRIAKSKDRTSTANKLLEINQRDLHENVNKVTNFH